MRNSIQIEGLGEVLARLEGLANPEQLKSNMGQACALLEREAKIKAPKDTGALRNSITSKVEVDGTEVVGIVFTPLEYAPYVEYGTGKFATNGRQQLPWRYQDEEGNWHTTSGQEPQPFMRDTIDENRLEVVRILQRGLIQNDD